MSKFQKVLDDLGRMKKVSELVDYIPLQGIQKTACFLLLVWCFVPAVVLVRSIFLEVPGELLIELNNQTALNGVWYIFLQLIGIIGCFLSLFALIKGIRQSFLDGSGLRPYLLSHLFPGFLFLMMVWSILSWMASDNRPLSFFGTSYRYDGLQTYFLYCGIFGCAYLIRGNRHVRNILACFSAAAMLLSLLVLIRVESFYHFFNITENSSIFYNQNHFGYYLCLALMCSLLLYMIEQRGRLWLAGELLGFSVIAAALVQSNSLGPYLAAAMGLIMLIVMVHRQDKNVKLRLWLAVIMFIAVSYLMNLVLHSITNDTIQLINDAESIINNTEMAVWAGSGRWELWKNGVRFILEKPLFGYGPENLGARYAAVGITLDRPHNELIQFAASLGIPALLFYLSALAVQATAYLRRYKQLSLAAIGLFCAIATYFISALFGNTMFYTTPFYLMVLGLSRTVLADEDARIKKY